MVWNHQVHLLSEWLDWRIHCVMYLKNSSLSDLCQTRKVASTYLLQILGGSIEYWWLFVQRYPHKYWPQLDLQVTPWQPLWFAQRIGFETGSMCYLDRTQAALWCYWLTWLFNLGFCICSNLSLMISNARCHWNWCKECNYIKWSDTFPLFYPGVSYFICKLFTVVNMVYGLTNKRNLATASATHMLQSLYWTQWTSGEHFYVSL